jgi:hypothetical protein
MTFYCAHKAFTSAVNDPRAVEAFVRTETQNKDVILYRFFHYRGRARVEHGWVVTSTDDRLIRSFFTGPTWKSADAVAHAILEITRPRAA